MSSDAMKGAGSSDGMLPRGRIRTAFEQCDEFQAGSPENPGLRCQFERGHEGPHSWEPVEGSLEKAISKTRNAIHRDQAEAKEQAEAEPGRGMPDYFQVMRPFIQQMFAEMESNFYKGDPEPYRKCDVATGMGEVFYHVLKLAWLVKHKPENKTALAEYTADVANCAFILFANLEGQADPEHEPTLVGEIGLSDEFQQAFDEMFEWIAEHFGWSREDMCIGGSD